ncbi:hypothetical protein RRG08_063997 [Elysia crispata]|uniref:Uncharacterized protein n=1 Tax=Elysia crispata TaxID=231223 RepID=A0AAE1CXJ1_9GAST|nr:hypothetical protein RRG08_063997 [Elysia crispata]
MQSHVRQFVFRRSSYIQLNGSRFGESASSPRKCPEGLKSWTLQTIVNKVRLDSKTGPLHINSSQFWTKINPA